MSKLRAAAANRKAAKEKESTIFFKTGDGKKIKADRGICEISEFLTATFKDEKTVYFENATERTIKLLSEFYDKYIGLSSTQLAMLGDPPKYFDVKKPDPELVRLYNSYKELSYADLFGLLKTADDMQITSLTCILSHIIANIIANKSVDDIEDELATDK